MYSGKISTVLGIVCISIVTAAFSFQTRAPFVGSEGASSAVVAEGVILKNVEGRLNTLKQQVHSRMPAGQKVQLLRQTLSSIQETRKSGPVATVDKEIYMDYSVESLEHVATDRSFSLEKCPEYKARVMNDFEPYSERRPSHPALKRSYEIIEGICS